MRKPLLYLLIFLLLLAAPSAVRYLQYYRLGGAQRAEPPRYEPAAVAAVPTPAASNFVDEPQTGEGIVLLDQAHDNRFDLAEINYLDARLSARGYQLMPHTSGDLAAALRPANAYVVIAPLVDYTQEEVVAVIDFVQRGGRLLLVGDPTRYSFVFSETDIFAPPTLETAELPLNSLANPFDITFNNDYLYNTAENEGNFRNIILNSDSMGDGQALTDHLEQLVFYGSHSLQVGPTAAALLTGDSNTWSSDTDRPGNLPLAALSPAEPTNSGGQVLAVGDLHFLMEPYYTVYDNGRFAAQVADFLADGDERVYTVRDFPHFFGNAVDLVFSGGPELGPDAFDEIINLQAAFRMLTKSLALTAEPDPNHDILQLGLYNQADEVADLLEAAGITLTIDPPIEEEPEEAATADEQAAAADDAAATPAEETAVRRIESTLGQVQMSGTALILFDDSNADDSDEQQRVIVLAASKEGLENTINRLIDLVPLNADYALADCLLEDNLALCPTGVADEAVEAVLDTSGTPEEAPPIDGESPPGEIDAIPQGDVELGETVEGTLAADERHAWTFSGGPATIDIVVQANEDMDAILELYDPDNNQVDSADSSFAGGEEILSGVEVEAGDYTIVVRDYFNDGGSYELAVREGEPGTGEDEGEEAAPIENIFIFADDDGEPLLDGFTSSEALAALLSDYTVQVWSATADGSLQEGMLDNYDLVIWDSGDYRDVEGLFDEDTGIIINYLDSGGEVLITGASPTLFGEIELAPLNTIEVVGDDPLLLEGLTAGDVIELDQTYETTLTEVFEQADTEEVFLVRGSDEEAAGAAIGLAAVDETLNNQKSIFLFVPFVALPADIQETLLRNMLAWFNE